MKPNERQMIFELDKDLVNRAKAACFVAGYSTFKAWVVEAFEEKILRGSQPKGEPKPMKRGGYKKAES